MDGLEYLQTNDNGELSFCKIDNLKVKPEMYPYMGSLISAYVDLTEEEQIQFFKSLLKYVDEIPNPELWKDVFNDRKIDDAKKLMQTELNKEGQRSFKNWATKIYFAIKFNILIRDILFLNSNENVITDKMVETLLYFEDFMDSTDVKRLKAYNITDYIQKNEQIKNCVLNAFNRQHFQIELKKALNTKRYKLPMPDGFDQENLRTLFQELIEFKKRIVSEKGEKEKLTNNNMQFIDTEEIIFLSLFQDGIKDDVKIKWIEKKYYFDYLMRELYDNRKIRIQIVETLQNVFVDGNGNGLNFNPDPNGRDQKPQTTPKQNIITNIVNNCKNNKR